MTRTDPKVGTELAPGQNVIVYVSTGPATAVMPSVVGLYSQTAQKQLADLGFTNVRTETVRSDRPKGEVVSQSVQKDTVLKLDDEIVLRLSDESGAQTTETQAPTETTEASEKTLTVRFTVPNKEEPYLLTILQDGAVIVEDEKIPAGCTDYSLTLTGSGTKEYDLYINGEKYVTQRVNFDG